MARRVRHRPPTGIQGMVHPMVPVRGRMDLRLRCGLVAGGGEQRDLEAEYPRLDAGARDGGCRSRRMGLALARRCFPDVVP